MRHETAGEGVTGALPDSTVFGALAAVACIFMKHGSHHEILEKVLRRNIRQSGAKPLGQGSGADSVVRFRLRSLRNAGTVCSRKRRERIKRFIQKEMPLLGDAGRLRLLCVRTADGEENNDQPGRHIRRVAGNPAADVNFSTMRRARYRSSGCLQTTRRLRSAPEAGSLQRAS